MTVELTPAAANDLSQIKQPVYGRMVKLLKRLENWPNVSGAKPLSGPLAGRFRLRTGDYRMQFHVTESTVIVEKIGHRDGFYE